MSDEKVIKRVSLTMPLEQRYASSKAGGQFDAHKANTNNMMLGLNGELGYSQLSKTLTIEAGFTTNMGNQKQENFKENVLGGKGKRGTGLYRVDDTTKYKP